jgi:hypothetical protein
MRDAAAALLPDRICLGSEAHPVDSGMANFGVRGLRMYQCKLFVSLLIMLVVGLHALPLLQRLQGKEQTWWPIMAWGMYSPSIPKGPISSEIRRTTGLTISGKQLPVGPEQSGLDVFTFGPIYVRSTWPESASAAQQLAERLNVKRDDPFVEFHLEVETYTITPSGIVKDTLPVALYRVSK